MWRSIRSGSPTSSARARSLAEIARGGKAVLYTNNGPQPLAVAQAASRQLSALGLDVELRPLPGPVFLNRLVAKGEPWDMALLLWAPDFTDPFQYINLLFDGRAELSGNVGTLRVDDPHPLDAKGRTHAWFRPLRHIWRARRATRA